MESTQENQDRQIPTKEDIINMLSEQIEVKTLQVQLQKLNAEFAQHRLEELKSIAISAQITAPRTQAEHYEGGIPHTITQEDLDENPDLAGQGLKVGDEVLIPAENKETPAVEEKTGNAEKRVLKK